MRDLVVESHAMAGVHVRTFVGRRMDLKRVVEEEVQGKAGGLAVVVSGPPGMADEVRLAVAGVAARGAEVVFVEESYSW